MGKKKSVVFITLITIVMLVLCAVVAFPKVPIPGTNKIKKWNPAAMQYDLGSEFGGGYYAYYYPEGVISEMEFNDNMNGHREGEDLWNEYACQYVQHGGLYLSTDPDDCIIDGYESHVDIYNMLIVDNPGVVTEGFKTAFAKSVELITERFEERAALTGSTYNVSVVDDYAIRVDVSASENSKGQTSGEYALQTFAQFANLGEVTLEITKDETSELVSELKEEDVTVKDLIKSVSAKTRYEVSYVKITFTDKGKEMIKNFKENEEMASATLDLKLGGETLMQISAENHINDKNQVEYGVSEETESLYAETLCVLINSAIEKGGVYINDRETTPLVLNAPSQESEIASYDPIYGDVFVWVLVTILLLIVLASALLIWRMGGFGIMNAYTSVSYLIIASLCFAFISGGVFVVSLGSVLVFLTGLALVNVLNVYVYNAIKNEATQGKTVQSSVKSGYKKTFWAVFDIYAVLLLGAAALLIGVASVQTLACQALICLFAGAFCNLLWGRFINLLLLSASKDKYKYFRFVREEDDDDE